MRESPVPLVTDSTDAAIRTTASTLCGSDLNLYHGLVPATLPGDVLGHESVGIVDEVGPDVKRYKKGDCVAISAVVACGQCDHCQHK
jgi:threonine dehydrogenase-like Zn-dependent dehydrogenase